MIKKILPSIICLSLIAACGKKSGLIYDGEQEKDKFHTNIEGYDVNSDEDFQYYFDRKDLEKKEEAEEKKPVKKTYLDYFDKKPEEKKLENSGEQSFDKNSQNQE